MGYWESPIGHLESPIEPPDLMVAHPETPMDPPDPMLGHLGTLIGHPELLWGIGRAL